MSHSWTRFAGTGLVFTLFACGHHIGQGTAGARSFVHVVEDSYCCDRDSGGMCVPVSTTLDPSAPHGANLRALMCTPHPDGAFHRAAKATLDPLAPDPVQLAFMSIACVTSGDCSLDESGVPRSYGNVAELYVWTQRVSPDFVRSAASTLGAPRNATDAFVYRYDSARTEIARLVATFPRRVYRVWVDGIDNALRQRFESGRVLAQFSERFAVLQRTIAEELGRGRVLRETPADAAALRAEVVQACVAQGRSVHQCLGGPIARPLTYALLQMAVLERKSLVAHTEMELLAGGPDRTSAMTDLHVAVDEAMARESLAARASGRIANRGDDSDTRYGEDIPYDMTGIRNDAGMEPAPAVPPMGFSELAVTVVAGEVRTVTRQRDKIRIELAGALAPTPRGACQVGRFAAFGRFSIARVALECAPLWMNAQPNPATIDLDAEKARLVRTGDVIQVFESGRDVGLIRLFSGSPQPVQIADFEENTRFR